MPAGRAWPYGRAWVVGSSNATHARALSATTHVPRRLGGISALGQPGVARGHGRVGGLSSPYALAPGSASLFWLRLKSTISADGA